MSRRKKKRHKRKRERKACRRRRPQAPKSQDEETRDEETQDEDESAKSESTVVEYLEYVPPARQADYFGWSELPGEQKTRRPRDETRRELCPPAGATVLLCEHALDVDEKLHFWELRTEDGRGYDFRRPDGSTGFATWAVSCNDCFVEAGGQFALLKIKNDGEWVDGEPIYIDKDPGRTSPHVKGELHEEHRADDISQINPWGDGPEDE